MIMGKGCTCLVYCCFTSFDGLPRHTVTGIKSHSLSTLQRPLTYKMFESFTCDDTRCRADRNWFLSILWSSQFSKTGLRGIKTLLILLSTRLRVSSFTHGYVSSFWLFAFCISWDSRSSVSVRNVGAPMLGRGWLEVGYPSQIHFSGSILPKKSGNPYDIMTSYW